MWTNLAALLGLSTSPALGQQRTFHLDRLEMPGGPDDGLAIFRPTTLREASFTAQLGLGYSLNPLKTSTIVASGDRTTLNASARGVIEHQLTNYFYGGFHLADRFILGVSLPVTWVQSGQNPKYAGGGIAAVPGTSTVSTDGPTVSDTRLDARAIVWRRADRRAAVGAQLSVFAPSGSVSSTNFGGDSQFTTMLLVSGEYEVRPFTLVANTGVHFRPINSINQPSRNAGLGIGNEWRWALGAFLPLRNGKYRVGATIFGQTGIESDSIIGDTFFKKRNTPIEWNVEGRMKFGPRDQLWAGAGAGSFILDGYGAPDFRIVALVGLAVPIVDSTAVSPTPLQRLREKWKAERVSDADKDGVPDDIDACPDEPEDHLGNDSTDGCPLPPDRDGDGIPDSYDKCPDRPEDKDGVQDNDGCPEEDPDSDGIPDAVDACPEVPGKAKPDPKKNGCPTSIEVLEDQGIVKTLQQVHFKTNSAEILPSSFEMLQEIADFLKVSPHIQRVSIEGHTDNRGAAAYNLKLSQSRADSVKAWLTSHGIAAERLEAHGYGLTRPIETNDTDEGRAANRRVEFKIIKQGENTTPAAPPKP